MQYLLSQDEVAFYRTDASGKFPLEAMAANRCDGFYYSGVNVLRGGHMCYHYV